eukprot:CAMPEP_0168530758 /NCGR_PEP_ID=MMETSP0405-20121227/14910_1 /TAXON_ID=498012 /ORGANISM="Trichosphaerium sp, Strain Am-I-7 wt" /LENGTH=922 /DNA_ID=CAMNT_0008555165 /DNA_START=25 /DNA_END=2793 /DNA_ORIENTATION=-
MTAYNAPQAYGPEPPDLSKCFQGQFRTGAFKRTDQGFLDRQNENTLTKTNKNTGGGIGASSSYPVTGNIVRKLTVGLITTLQALNNEFGYSVNNNPRRVLTKPSEPSETNGGHDNVEHNYILYVNDVIIGNRARYIVMDVLGQGSFGQVVKCFEPETKQMVALKIVKNLPAYLSQGLVEVSILKMLNSVYDPDQYPIVRLLDCFIYRNHLCMVFELLGVSLYDLLVSNNHKGFSLKLIRHFTRQLLKSLVALREVHVIHCDLKPENILLVSNGTRLKVIDFGSACYSFRAPYSYIQSRFYRSPEVILGSGYYVPIDIWSLGCIMFELFYGLPLFPGQNEHRMLQRFIEILGPPPRHILERGNKVLNHFDSNTRLKTDAQWKHDNSIKQNAPEYRDYFRSKDLKDIIFSYAYREGMVMQEVEDEKELRSTFLDMLSVMLCWDPRQRWTADQLLAHPFITGQPLPNGPPPPRPVPLPPLPPNFNGQQQQQAYYYHQQQAAWSQGYPPPQAYAMPTHGNHALQYGRDMGYGMQQQSHQQQQPVRKKRSYSLTSPSVGPKAVYNTNIYRNKNRRKSSPAQGKKKNNRKSQKQQKKRKGQKGPRTTNTQTSGRKRGEQKGKKSNSPNVPPGGLKREGNRDNTHTTVNVSPGGAKHKADAGKKRNTTLSPDDAPEAAPLAAGDIGDWNPDFCEEDLLSGSSSGQSTTTNNDSGLQESFQSLKISNSSGDSSSSMDMDYRHPQSNRRESRDNRHVQGNTRGSNTHHRRNSVGGRHNTKNQGTRSRSYSFKVQSQHGRRESSQQRARRGSVHSNQLPDVDEREQRVTMPAPPRYTDTGSISIPVNVPNEQQRQSNSWHANSWHGNNSWHDNGGSSWTNQQYHNVGSYGNSPYDYNGAPMGVSPSYDGYDYSGHQGYSWMPPPGNRGQPPR